MGRRARAGVVTGLVAAAAASCALMPVRREHLVRMVFEAAPERHYFVDEGDSAAVCRTDELVVTVRYLTKQMLNAEYAQYRQGRVNLNPFTYGTQMDNSLGYVPDRFTVFELDVNNIALPKVDVDPRQAILETDQGARLRPWAAKKGEARDTFEEYYRALQGAGGNDQDWFRQRLSIAERALHNGERPVFKGERNRGKLVFEVLPEDVRWVRLVLPEVAVRFDADGLPVEEVELEFVFGVEVVVRPQ